MTKTRKLQLLLVTLTVLALGAGLTAGLLSARLPARTDTNPPDSAIERTPLVDELNLSAAQRDKMKAIWESAQKQAQQAFQDAQGLQKSRDERIFSLLNDEQKAKFTQISREFADRYDVLQEKRDTVFNQAVNQTRGLLTEEQQKKYDQILRSHVGSATLDRLNAGGTLPTAR